MDWAPSADQLLNCSGNPVCLNAMFFKRMAYPSFTVSPYATGVNVLLDAIAVRDHNAIAAAVDSSAFVQQPTRTSTIPGPGVWVLPARLQRMISLTWPLTSGRTW
jgi:hypothetical protein